MCCTVCFLNRARRIRHEGIGEQMTGMPNDLTRGLETREHLDKMRALHEDTRDRRMTMTPFGYHEI